ncbi:MAG: hypothetical protein LGB01_06925 [Sulfurovum sp.]|nr:hypothetical protein [Sulfurovum sp.]
MSKSQSEGFGYADKEKGIKATLADPRYHCWIHYQTFYRYGCDEVGREGVRWI